MTRSTASSPAETPAVLLKKHPPRDTAALLEDIAALTALAGQSGYPHAADKALAWSDVAARRKLDATQRCLLAFYTASAFIGRHHESHPVLSAWEQPDIEKAIFHLKTAIDDPAFAFFDAWRRGQILTLLGNQYSYMGDILAALDCWDRAIAIDTRLGMALGNRGKAIADYAERLSDTRLKPAFFGIALDNLAAATDDDACYYGDAQGKDYFRAELEKIDATLDPDSDLTPPDPPLPATGKPKKDKPFRKWCLAEKLYLNPLNDLCRLPAAAYDIVDRPLDPASAPTGDLQAMRYLSQLCQEYLAIRQLAYRALTDKALEHTDRIEQAASADWRMATESLKLACRAAWALLPKIAQLVGEYFAATRPETRSTLKTVWYRNGQPNAPLQDVFAQSQNAALRGLFWLSKSLPAERHAPSLDPDSAQTRMIAETLEKSCLRVAAIAPDAGGIVDQTLSLHTLMRTTLKLLKQNRNALVYLTEAIAFKQAWSPETRQP